MEILLNIIFYFIGYILASKGLGILPKQLENFVDISCTSGGIILLLIGIFANINIG